MSDVVPLREYFESRLDESDKRNEQRFLAQEKAVTSALAAAEKAVNVAERNAEQWRAGANEWRGSMTDRERNFASKGDLDAIKERLDRSEGKGTGLHAGWGYIVGAAGLIAAIASVIAMVFK
jgi:hypothetical protein